MKSAAFETAFEHLFPINVFVLPGATDVNLIEPVNDSQTNSCSSVAEGPL